MFGSGDTPYFALSVARWKGNHARPYPVAALSNPARIRHRVRGVGRTSRDKENVAGQGSHEKGFQQQCSCRNAELRSLADFEIGSLLGMLELAGFPSCKPRVDKRTESPDPDLVSRRATNT